VTPSGRTFLVLTVGVGVGALNTGNNLLYMLLGLQLSTIVVSGVLSEMSLRSVRVRRLGSDAAFAQEPFTWRWALSREGGRSYALSVSELDGPLSGEGHIAVLEPGKETLVRSAMLAAERGPVRLTAVRVSTVFPLGLFRKSRLFHMEDVLWVYPRRIRPRGELPSLPTASFGARADPRHADGDGEVHSLRPLRPGEDARRVHWVKSASAGTLLRVDRERERRPSYTLTVPSGLSVRALDAPCEEAAAFAHRLLCEGWEVGLTSGTVRLRPGAGLQHERRILKALAQVGFDEARNA
jgi:uncharacterized protein (DUF58 family)